MWTGVLHRYGDRIYCCQTAYNITSQRYGVSMSVGGAGEEERSANEQPRQALLIFASVNVTSFICTAIKDKRRANKNKQIRG